MKSHPQSHRCTANGNRDERGPTGSGCWRGAGDTSVDAHRTPVFTLGRVRADSSTGPLSALRPGLAYSRPHGARAHQEDPLLSPGDLRRLLGVTDTPPSGLGGPPLPCVQADVV